jgi:hypothetical protein
MFIKGLTYGFGARSGDYRTPEAVSSMEKLKNRAANGYL